MGSSRPASRVLPRESFAIRVPNLLPFILLTVALLGGLVMAYRLIVEAKEDLEPDSASDLLDEFEEAHAAGEIDEEELRRVRASLERMRFPEPARREEIQSGPEPLLQSGDAPPWPLDSNGPTDPA